MVMVPVQPVGVQSQMSQTAPVKPDPIQRNLCARNLFGTDRKDGNIDKLYADEQRENLEKFQNRFNIDLGEIDRIEKEEKALADKCKKLAKCNQQQENVGVDINRISKMTSQCCRDYADTRKPYAPSGIKATYKVIKMRNSNVPKHKNNTIIIINNNNNNNSSSNNNNNAQLKLGNSEILDKNDNSGNNDNNGNK